MKTLVSGGAGFVGSAVIRLAMHRGHEVVNLDALTYAACLDNLASVSQMTDYAFENADIRDASHVREAPNRQQPHTFCDEINPRPSMAREKQLRKTLRSQLENEADWPAQLVCDGVGKRLGMQP